MTSKRDIGFSERTAISIVLVIALFILLGSYQPVFGAATATQQREITSEEHVMPHEKFIQAIDYLTKGRQTQQEYDEEQFKQGLMLAAQRVQEEANEQERGQKR